LQEAKIWGFGKESLFPGCKEGVHLGKEEWGFGKGGSAPFLRTRDTWVSLKSSFAS